MANILNMKSTTNPSNLITNLEERCLHLEQKNAELSAKVKWYEEQFRLAQKRKYAASSEKSDSEQLLLFNEAEQEAQPLLAEPTLEKITYERKKKQPGQREAMLKDLPVEMIIYSLPAEEQTCSCCAGKLHKMKTEIPQELEIIPAKVSVMQHVRKVYACRKCQQEGTTTPIITAPMPNPVLKGSLASPSTLAHVMNQKYVDGLPLCRQEQQFARLGLKLSRQTLANWVLYGADKWLVHLYERLHQHLLQRDILHADDYRNIFIIETGPAECRIDGLQAVDLFR